MIINGKDSFNNVKILNKIVIPAAFETSSKWPKESIIPINVKSKFTYGSMKLELLIREVKGSRIGDLVSDFIKEISNSTIKLDDFIYKVRLISTSVDDYFLDYMTNTYCQKIILNLTVDEKYKEEILIEISGLNQSISVFGNLDTPCILEITPTQAMVDLMITGLSNNPIIIKNLLANKKVIIDGESETITVDGINKFGDTDMWEFPRLIPGVNEITFSKSYLTGIIKYKQRYV